MDKTLKMKSTCLFFCCVLTICIQKSSAGGPVVPIVMNPASLMPTSIMGMPSSNKSQGSSSCSSCPCTSGTTAVSAVVAKELVTVNYILIVTPSIVAGVLPLGAATLVYLTGPTAYISINEVVGYVLNVDRFYYYFNVLGCPRIDMLNSNSPALIPGTTLKQSDAVTGAQLLTITYLGSCNSIPGATNVYDPSSSQNDGLHLLIDGLLSAYIIPRNGESIPSVTSDIQKLNYNVTAQSTLQGTLVQEKGNTVSATCALQADGQMANGDVSGGSRTLVVNQGVCAFANFVATQLFASAVTSSIFIKIVVFGNVFAAIFGFTISDIGFALLRKLLESC